MPLQLRPMPLLRQISNVFLPRQDGASSNAPSQSPSPPAEGERARLLLPNTSSSDTFTDLLQPASDRLENRPLSSPAARPSIRRGVTVAGVLCTEVSTGSTFLDTATPPAQPVSGEDRPTCTPLAKPHLLRAATAIVTTAVPVRNDRTTMAPGRTTVLSRVTQVLSDYRDAPPAPSNWNDEAHQRHLVRIWDAVDARAAQAKYDVPLLARIISTERNMLHVYPELAQGKIPMNHDWIEYVLGVALRHPFCTAASMGRWEVLASSGGARGTWGPW